VIGLLYLQLSGNAQSGQNPFDIQNRLDSIYETNSSSPAPSNSNVFDIVRTSPEPTTVIPETEIVTTEKQEESISDKEAVISKSPAVVQTVIEDLPAGGNPFEVSHIPLRKSKLKQEADAFVSTTSNASKGQQESSNTFIFWLILLSGVFIAFVINTKAHVIPRLMKSITNINVLTYNMREENGGLSGQYIILYLTYFINAAVLLYLLGQKYTSFQGFTFFLYCLGGAAAVYISKHLILGLLGYVFPINRDISVYNFSIEAFNIILGLILIPLNLVIAFGPSELSDPFIYIALGLIGLLLIIRSVRGLFIAAPYMQKNFFQFFVYLCGIEIVPILLLIKLVQ